MEQKVVAIVAACGLLLTVKEAHLKTKSTHKGGENKRITEKLCPKPDCTLQSSHDL